MPGKVFIDTNLWIYRFLSSRSEADKSKREKVELLFLNNAALTISTQVLCEVSNVLLKKYGFEVSKVTEHIKHILQIAEVHMHDEDTIFKALSIVRKYGFNFYDAVIVASSLEAGCVVLYSEDMQNGQVIEGKLKIINPFM